MAQAQGPELVEDEGADVTELVRVGVDLFLTLISAYVFWCYMKERPEYGVAAARVRGWWHKVSTSAAELRRAERETVFEAMQVVDYGRTADDAGS